jgi:hypothetical protein
VIAARWELIVVRKGAIVMENIMMILVTLCLMGAVTGVNPSGSCFYYK